MPRCLLRPLWPALHPPGTGLIRTLEGHTSGVAALAVMPDGCRAVSASFDKTLKLWDWIPGANSARWKVTQAFSMQWH